MKRRSPAAPWERCVSSQRINGFPWDSRLPVTLMLQSGSHEIQHMAYFIKIPNIISVKSAVPETLRGLSNDSLGGKLKGLALHYL